MTSKHSTNLVNYFIQKFVLIILLPGIVLFLAYLIMLNTYFAKNALQSQQNYLENTVSQLNLSSKVDSIFNMLEGLSGLNYYLDTDMSKEEQLYRYLSELQKPYLNLEQNSPGIRHICIRSSNDHLLYVPLFEKLEESVLPQDILDSYLSGNSLMLWYVVSDTSANKTSSIPQLYAFRKLYTFNYLHLAAIMEIEIDTSFLGDFIAQFDDSSMLNKTGLEIYQNDTLLYRSPTVSAYAESPKDAQMSQKTGISFSLLRNRYMNSVILPDQNLQLVLSGRLTDLAVFSANLPIIFTTLFIVILFFLLVSFLSYFVKYSRQLQAFSAYLQNSNTDHLSAYIPATHLRKGYQELQVLISSYNALILEKSVLISRAEQAELLSQQAKFQALQSQIHPHFLFGTLENIRMLALQNDDDMVSEMLFSLSELLRYAISINQDGIPLQDELRIAKTYLQLQKMRFEDRLNPEFHIDSSLLDTLMPPFILQPLLENAISYGIAKTYDPCRLIVSIQPVSTGIKIDVANEGVLISIERLNEVNQLLLGQKKLYDFRGRQNGLALYNINERLHSFFSHDVSLYLTLDDMTHTIIIFPKGAAYVSDSDRR